MKSRLSSGSATSTTATASTDVQLVLVVLVVQLVQEQRPQRDADGDPSTMIQSMTVDTAAAASRLASVVAAAESLRKRRDAEHDSARHEQYDCAGERARVRPVRRQVAMQQAERQTMCGRCRVVIAWPAAASAIAADVALS